MVQNGFQPLLTYSLAVLGQCIHLITFIALAFIVSFIIYTDLTTSIRIFAFIYVCKESLKAINNLQPNHQGMQWVWSEYNYLPQQKNTRDMQITSTCFLVQKFVSRRTFTFIPNF